MNLRNGVLAASFLILASGTAFADPVNLVSNGSFQSCTVSCTTAQLGYASYSSGGQNYTGVSGATLIGWTNTSTYAYVVTASALANGTVTVPNASTASNPAQGSISMYSFPTLSPDGGNFILVDSDYNLNSGPTYNRAPTYNAGGVSQTLTGLTIGQIYNVGFYMAAAQQSGYTGATTDTWDVSFGATTEDSQTLSISQGGFSGWVYDTLSFVADATTDTLSFAATGTGSPPFVALDGVTVTVPEPSTWAILGLGLVGVVVVSRKRLRRT